MNKQLNETFDCCVRGIEKCQSLFPEAVATLNRTCVFEFPFAEAKKLPQTLAEFGRRLSDAFFLPFPVVGVLNDNTLVSLWDQNHEVKTIGVGASRGYIIALRDGDTVTTAWGQIEDVDFLERREPTILDGPQASTQNHFRAKIGIAGIVEMTPAFPSGRTAFDGERWHPAPPPGKPAALPFGPQETKRVMDQIAQHVISVVCMAYMDIAFFNTPNRFVLQVSPEKLREREKPTKILRSAERPFYTLLTPGQIKKVMRIKGEHTDSEGRVVTYRRAHSRYLGSDVFVHMQGQTIFVKAVWNFDEECVVDKKRYRVMVDV